MLLSADSAHADFTTADCLAQKQKVWGGLRKCEAGEKAKLLQSKPADLGKCQTKFADKIAKLNEKAADAAIACRFGDNGDGTVTDYNTGLQWEQKTDDGSVHDKDTTSTWSSGDTQPNGSVFSVFLAALNNGTSTDGTATSGCFAGHCDWRLPAIQELAGIVDATQGNCGGGAGPCIDETAFGPTVASLHWSASTNAGNPNLAWRVDFNDGGVVGNGVKNGIGNYKRAVRSGL